jgi:hypothetical protein
LRNVAAKDVKIGLTGATRRQWSDDDKKKTQNRKNRRAEGGGAVDEGPELG